MDLVIDKNVPMPSSRSKWSDIIKKMKTGHSVVVPKSSRPAIWKAANNLGVNVVSRSVDQHVVRVWKT